MSKTLGFYLYGSQNYCLDNATSDKDYKMIVMPSVRDLYSNAKLEREADQHTSTMGVQKFISLLFKGNPNCWEYLFSSNRFEMPQFQLLTNSLRENSQVILQNAYADFSRALNGIVINTKHITDVGKQYSRYIYFYNFYNYVIEHNYALSEDSYRNIAVYSEARYAREHPEEITDIEKYKNYDYPLVSPFKCEADAILTLDKVNKLKEQCFQWFQETLIKGE